MWRGINRKLAKRCVGKGWSFLIDILYDYKPRLTKVYQVKEKFGTLRFYVGYSDTKYDQIIDMCEWESSRVCEKCGQRGKTREDLPWILTLCDNCYKEKTDELYKRR